MYTGVSLAEQLEFDSWPEAQKKLAKKIFYNKEVLAAYYYLDIPPRKSELNDNPS